MKVAEHRDGDTQANKLQKKKHKKSDDTKSSNYTFYLQYWTQ